jgi:hypothetical protein
LKNFIKNIGFSSALYDQFGEEEEKHVDTEVDLPEEAAEGIENGDSDDSNDTNGSDSDEDQDEDDEDQDEDDEDQDEDDEEEADSDDAAKPSVVTKPVASTEKVIKDKNANLVNYKRETES